MRAVKSRFRWTHFIAIVGVISYASDLYAQETAGLAVSRSTARTIRVPSQVAGGDRIAAVLLPAGYDESEKRYPVVYLFHGGGQDHTAFMARTAFAPMARRHDVIVVMPAADRNYSRAGAEIQQRFHDFVASELVPYIDTHYRTIASRGGRAIGGISMGGRLSVMTALGHPQQFGIVGAFSAAFQGMPSATRDTDEAPFYYVSCGTADTLLAANRQFVQWLEENKVPHEYHEVAGKGHTWDLWDQEVATFFDLVSTRTSR